LDVNCVTRYLQESDLGEVLVQLNYLPSVERLTVTIHEARDLAVMDLGGLAGAE
jgi:hypothetical protein